MEHEGRSVTHPRDSRRSEDPRRDLEGKWMLYQKKPS